MKINHLKALAATAEHGGFRAAGRALGLSQVALAKQVKELELSIGQQLFVRTPRGAIPTDVARSLLPRAKRVLDELTRLSNEAHGLDAPYLSIALSPVVSLVLLADCLRRFNIECPGTQLSLSEGLLSLAIPRVRDGSVDFAVVAANPKSIEPDLLFEPCFNTANTFIGRTGHPLSKHQCQLHELVQFEWVQNEALGGYAENLSNWILAANVGTASVISCESFANILGVLLASDAIAVAPKALVNHSLLNKFVTQIDSIVAPPRSTIGFLSRRDLTLGKRALTMKTLIRDAVKDLGDVIVV